VLCCRVESSWSSRSEQSRGRTEKKDTAMQEQVAIDLQLSCINQDKGVWFRCTGQGRSPARDSAKVVARE
jgi:hypothetical protein